MKKAYDIDYDKDNKLLWLIFTLTILGLLVFNVVWFVFLF